MTFKTLVLVSVSALTFAASAGATSFTRTSPNGGALPTGVTEVGGIVLDLRGLNGVRVVSQLAASSLYVGFAGANPQVIGTQTGFTAQTLSALGGGLQSASVRVTLFDGDSAPGNFDAGADNTFFLDGINFGTWGAVATERTDNTGLTSLGFGTGFGDSILSTGFFSNNNAADMATLFAALGDGLLVYSLFDVDPFDNFYDFTQGVDGGLINVGRGPSVVPEPSSWAMLIAGFGLVGASMRRRSRVAAVAN
jgi:hypothetical protein